MKDNLFFLKSIVIFMGISLIAGISILFFLIIKKDDFGKQSCVQEDFVLPSVEDLTNINFLDKKAFIMTKKQIFIMDTCNNEIIKIISIIKE